jgi:hypothetical protein
VLGEANGAKTLWQDVVGEVIRWCSVPCVARKAHELCNEIVAELNLIRGAKVAQNRTPGPRAMKETVGQRGKKVEESKN